MSNLFAELDQLIERLRDDSLTKSEQEWLIGLLKQGPPWRKRFVRQMALSAAMRDHLETEPNNVIEFPRGIRPEWMWKSVAAIAGAAVAAGLACCFSSRLEADHRPLSAAMISPLGNPARLAGQQPIQAGIATPRDRLELLPGQRSCKEVCCQLLRPPPFRRRKPSGAPGLEIHSRHRIAGWWTEERNPHCGLVANQRTPRRANWLAPLSSPSRFQPDRSHDWGPARRSGWRHPRYGRRHIAQRAARFGVKQSGGGGRPRNRTVESRSPIPLHLILGPPLVPFEEVAEQQKLSQTARLSRVGRRGRIER